MNKITNIPRNIAIFFIEFYQKYISKYTSKRCKFYPTCSEYSRQALKKYGFFKGLFFSIKRILKCNPFSNGGIDTLK